MYKKVFRLGTTFNANAKDHQDTEIHQWLINLMSDYARKTYNNDFSETGRSLNIIVEVLEA